MYDIQIINQQLRSIVLLVITDCTTVELYNYIHTIPNTPSTSFQIFHSSASWMFAGREYAMLTSTRKEKHFDVNTTMIVVATSL